MRDKQDINHSENALNGVSSGGSGKNKSCMRHCKKLWWAYLLLLVVITAIVVPVIILVAVPKIAQHKLDEAELVVDGITLSNTKSNSYTMAINSTLKSDGKVKATIEGFEGVMYLEDLEPHTPFVTINFPETKSVKEQTVNISQPIQIQNMAAFTTFNTWFQANESLRVTVYGETHVKVSGLPKRYPVTFKNTVTLQALNDFKGLNVTESEISLTPDANGDNFKGKVTIPNHSVITLEIGNASFRNLLNNNEIGTVYIDNLVLHPGDNNVNMRANISQAPVLTAIQAKPACENGVIPFGLNGKDVVNGGQRLSYFADALAAGTVLTDINVGAALKKIGLNLTCSS
ncbi:hypothetical protein K4K61_010587 [Colletotrichum sp. SAR11_59]|uniref:Uncharacterized protein n=1 Tax=Colletotrichum asianum TaxID=702518 RepID=A0A8H3WVK0_9PEZI|nr:hypothetical protein GQ607_000239 [Colletotrichum asianum]KAI8299452.1 hypothetical protein K4K61_010587 [Colletotrichum sp. SAR11_59]